MTGFLTVLSMAQKQKSKKDQHWMAQRPPKRLTQINFPFPPFLPVASCSAAVQPLYYFFILSELTACLLENLTCLHHNLHGSGSDHLPFIIINLSISSLQKNSPKFSNSYRRSFDFFQLKYSVIGKCPSLWTGTQYRQQWLLL